MWGAANQALSTQTADAFIAALRRAPVRERVLYPDGGHMLHVQRPGETASDALAFLLTHLKKPL
jgi:pimeloyl-ACP methyl ester carboxylesterase